MSHFLGFTMARGEYQGYSKLPTVEDCHRVNLRDLRRAGLMPGILAAVEYYPRSGSQITIYIDTREPSAEYLVFSYTVEKRPGDPEPVSFKVPLTRHPSNLVNGSFHYFFVCPKTGTRCTVLLCPPGATVYAHRSHWQNVGYRLQRESKGDQAITRKHRARARLEALEVKHGKHRYRGKPTRRARRYLLHTGKHKRAERESLESLAATLAALERKREKRKLPEIAERLTFRIE